MPAVDPFLLLPTALLPSKGVIQLLLEPFLHPTAVPCRVLPGTEGPAGRLGMDVSSSCLIPQLQALAGTQPGGAALRG